jgi:hypothetical protein
VIALKFTIYLATNWLRIPHLSPPLHLDEQTIERQKGLHHHYSSRHSFHSDSGSLKGTQIFLWLKVL